MNIIRSLTYKMAQITQENIVTSPTTSVAAHIPTYLQKKNPHPRDDNIVFVEEGHKYYINGEDGYTSVTTWIHSHFEHFDADKVINNMMASSKWSQNKYYGKTREEIKAGWDKSRDEAAQAGTNMHYSIECYYNNIDTINNHDGPSSKELEYFMNFVNSEHHKDLVPYRTEWTVYDEEAKIAGSIDMVYACANGEDANDTNNLKIYDWKRSKEIKKTVPFMKYAQTECISHIPDTNFWHYSLQLNIYKAILEKNYGKKVSDLYLVCLHPDNKDHLLFKVPNLQDEVLELFKYRKEQFKTN